MRRNRHLALLFSAIAAAVGAPHLVSANPVVSMELTGVEGPSMGGVYTSPYVAKIGPAGLTSASQFTSIQNTVDIYCDDFETHVGMGQIWQATVTNLSALEGSTSPLTTLKFDTTGTANQQQDDYMAAAWLAETLSGVDQSTPGGAEEAGQLSFAIWGIFDPNALSDLSGTDLSAAQGDITNAYAQITLTGYDQPDDYSNVDIYTPNPTSASQEYLTVRPVPEPATLSLLAFGLAAIVGVTRRRLRRSRAVA